MESKTMQVTFRIDGNFITRLAREKCYLEGKYDYAIELLMSSMECEQLAKNEINNIAMAILDGRAMLKGIYPDDDYGFEYLEEKDNKWDLSKLISNNFKKAESLQKENDEMSQKYSFISANLDDYDKKNLNELYKEEFDETLFRGLYSPSTGDTMLDSYIKRQLSDTKDDYGWLEPDGTYHPVDWGKHQDWADLYVQKNFPEEIYESIDTSYITKKRINRCRRLFSR